ncbi:hypothetical protein EZ428_12445 [Pedobacter frigiditerrae]|uniref:Glyoxalase/fosfomycin resistance/dioxygenase domain-containing protein n=1 Tax=Pedobacter frigiditerrae TaxID=2530452 RepID=A0A4R0MV69_9SPHI|nr:VOC family protein [Pedobacter frigiditerrae]TCC90092.1 hypothetical protein EZ428_12445 [Pedobacter frigiditerrae]
MSKEIKYVAVDVDKKQESILFYRKYLNFELHSTVQITVNEEWSFLNNCEGVPLGLILIKKKDGDRQPCTLILNAQDCLFEYCKLKETEINDLSAPIYSAIGLTISFSDPSGNRIILLEERKYNELDN